MDGSTGVKAKSCLYSEGVLAYEGTVKRETLQKRAQIQWGYGRQGVMALNWKRIGLD